MSTPPHRKFATVDEVLADMATRFHPEACQDLKAVYVWRLTGGPAPRDFVIHIVHGAFRISTDPADVKQGDVILEASTETYLRLVNKELRGAIAIMTRKLRVRGSLQLAARMDQIFI